MPVPLWFGEESREFGVSFLSDSSLSLFDHYGRARRALRTLVDGWQNRGAPASAHALGCASGPGLPSRQAGRRHRVALTAEVILHSLALTQFTNQMAAGTF